MPNRGGPKSFRCRSSVTPPSRIIPHVRGRLRGSDRSLRVDRRDRDVQSPTDPSTREGHSLGRSGGRWGFPLSVSEKEPSHPYFRVERPHCFLSSTGPFSFGLPLDLRDDYRLIRPGSDRTCTFVVSRYFYLRNRGETGRPFRDPGPLDKIKQNNSLRDLLGLQ